MNGIDGVYPAEGRTGWRDRINNWAVALCSVGLVAIALAGKYFHVEEAWMLGVAGSWTLLSLGTGFLLSKLPRPTEDKEFGVVLKEANKQGASYWRRIGAESDDHFERDFLEIDADTPAPGPGEREKPVVEGCEPFGAVASLAAVVGREYWAEVASDFEEFLGINDE